jgi:hypothetical protein
MTTRTARTSLLAGAVLVAMSAAAPAQVADDDHEAHHPEAELVVPEVGAPDAPNSDAPAMPGMMGMMTPEMMQMMMRMMGEGGMPGMMGGMRGGPMGEAGSGRGRMGPGMMGGGMTGGGMMGPGMMGPGMMGMDGMPTGPMMHGPRGHMGGHALGPGALYGMPHGLAAEMTPARVEAFLSHLLERHGNPRLEIGEITEADDGSIIAEIVTTDGSLVQRLAFNRFPGLFRQID